MPPLAQIISARSLRQFPISNGLSVDIIFDPDTRCKATPNRVSRSALACNDRPRPASLPRYNKRGLEFSSVEFRHRKSVALITAVAAIAAALTMIAAAQMASGVADSGGYWRQPLKPQGTPPKKWTAIERSLAPADCGQGFGVERKSRGVASSLRQRTNLGN